MRVLMKPSFYSGDMGVVEMGPNEWLQVLKNPLIRVDKFDAPLFTYGTPVQVPEPGTTEGSLHAVAKNISEYSAIQLDYDDGCMMDEWIEKFVDKFAFWTYTTFSYGIKPGDRFRVVIPLERPIPATLFGPAYTRYMEGIFPGCDLSAFAQAHFQALPVISQKGAPFRYFINSSKQKFSIDFEQIKCEKTKMENIQMAEMAFMRWRAKFSEEESESQRINNQIRWAQNQLDEAREGNRNATMFSVLSYLIRQSVPHDLILDLRPPYDCDAEWSRMLTRFYI